jgi:hypothetical protein
MPLPPLPPGPFFPPPAPAAGTPAPPIPVPTIDIPNGGLIPAPGREVSSLDFANIIGGPLTAAIKAQAASALTTVAFIKSVGFRNPPKGVTKGGPQTPGVDPGVMEPIYVTFKYPKELMPYQPAVTAGLVSVTLTNPGSGYTTVPRVQVTPDRGVEITAKLSGGSVSELVIVNAGTGWEGTETVTVTIDPPPAAVAPAPANVPATATVTLRSAKLAQSAVYETMALQVPLLTMLPIPYLRIEEFNLDFDVKIDQTEKVDITETVDIAEGLGAGGGAGASGFSGAANFSASISMQETGTYSNTINRKYSMNVKVKAVQAETPAGLERILSTLQASILAQPVNAFARA